MLLACTHAAPRPPVPACAPVARACDRGIADGDARAIVARRCVPCHAPAALGGPHVADALAACEMPPPGHVLEPAERELLVAWAACGTSTVLAR